ncbi:interferon-induced protein 35 [Mugil cephalus]|uniref:interferon-induced protein 35 n=1 Tax=Mugil cephalus TaxID=48193 RepID=UPI001FB8079C|nr:interferon-induced protein 35 [Mugil cephalus]
MSSDEDFSLVLDPSQSENTLEGINALINKFKKTHEQVLEEQKELAVCIKDRQDLVKQFKERTEKLTQTLKDDESSFRDQMANEKAKVNALEMEERELLEELERAKAALSEEEAQHQYLKEQTDVFTAVPERNLVFKGATRSADDTQQFDMKSRIEYPMLGGTTLITFEEEEVAKKILSMKSHRIELGGECSIRVEARPVHLMVPKLVEIDTTVCPQRILISNLPDMDTETLLNKLEIHFAKSKNGGGEVDDCEMLTDSGTVVLTFVEETIAKGLTETEFHEVKFQQFKHKVRVTPFLNGTIKNLETKLTQCPRTVLLSWIPAIMEPETLQDLVEIHFQKTSNGGGEIEAILYNPQGQQTTALFESV